MGDLEKLSAFKKKRIKSLMVNELVEIFDKWSIEDLAKFRNWLNKNSENAPWKFEKKGGDKDGG